MTAKPTSPGCAGPSSSGWIIASTMSALLVVAACGSSTRPPPPAHLDPQFADAGPALLLHNPWPQTGPFHCHPVAREGQTTTMCSRSQMACEQWRASNRENRFTVGPCSEELQAACFHADERELCFENAEQCNAVREAMNIEGMCSTVKAVWKPE